MRSICNSKQSHSQDGTSSVKHPANDDAFPRWTAIEIRWKMCAVSSLSSVMCSIRPPSSVKKLTPSSLIGPKVSTATGTKIYFVASSQVRNICPFSDWLLVPLQLLPALKFWRHVMQLVYLARLRPREDIFRLSNVSAWLHQVSWHPFVIGQVVSC